MDLPYVFVFDWDGTIAGKVDFQSQQYTLYNTLKKHGFKVQRAHPIPPAFHPNAKLIRPGFAQFVRAITKHFAPADVFMFIYTGSEKTWAHQEIQWVEKTHGISFQRPLFVRDDCTTDAVGNIRKSIAKVFPRIMRGISKTRVYTPTERITILEKRLIIIDNNSVYTDRTDKLLLCPDYSHAVFENLLHGLPADARKHPDVQKIIFTFVNQGALCPLTKESDDPMRALTKQYTWLAAKCKAITSINAAYENDDFWPYLARLIIKNQLTSFTPSIIKKLQDAVWKHAASSK